MEPPHIHGGMPMAGIVMAGIGVAGWCYNAAAHFVSVPIVAQAPAAAAPAEAGWAVTQQTVSGILVIVGGVITWLSLQRQNVADARRREQQKDEDARRENDRLNAMNRIEIKLAEMRVEQERVRLHMEAAIRSPGNPAQSESPAPGA